MTRSGGILLPLAHLVQEEQQLVVWEARGGS